MQLHDILQLRCNPAGGYIRWGIGSHLIYKGDI
jgi:hypothetical protein